MKRTITFDNPDKMHFESPLQVFNRQTVLLTRGNAILPTQYSSCIRSFDDTKCGEEHREKGELQEFDLKPFRKFGLGQRERRIRHALSEREGAGILYCFFHQSRNGLIVEGFLLTSKEHVEIERWYVNPDHRAHQAFEEAISYIVEQPEPAQ